MNIDLISNIEYNDCLARANLSLIIILFAYHNFLYTRHILMIQYVYTNLHILIRRNLDNLLKSCKRERVYRFSFIKKELLFYSYINIYI